MRCPRCGFDNPDSPRACARCGLALTEAKPPEQGPPPGPGSPSPQRTGPSQPGGQGQHHIPPSWQRQPDRSGESPPWSESQDAAPWQTPPQRMAGHWSVPSVGTSPSAIPPEPPRQRSAYPSALGNALVMVLALETVLALAYAVFALGPRRGIFADLGSHPAVVTREAATGSDTANLVLFVAFGLCTILAIVLGVGWAMGLRRARPERPRAMGLPWWLETAAGVIVVLVALGLHTSGEPARIALGYVVLGIGALLIAGSAVWALVRVRRAAPTPDVPGTAAGPPTPPAGRGPGGAPAQPGP